MFGKRVLVIVGSESLTKWPGALRWTKSVVEARMVKLYDRAIVLVVGESLVGGMAKSFARECGVRPVEFMPDGTKRVAGQASGRWSKLRATTWRVREALLDAATKSMESGWETKVVSLIAPWSGHIDTENLTPDADWAHQDRVLEERSRPNRLAPNWAA